VEPLRACIRIIGDADYFMERAWYVLMANDRLKVRVVWLQNQVVGRW